MSTLLDIGCNDLAGFRLLSKIDPVINNYRKIFVEANPECWDDLVEELKKNIKFIFNKKGGGR